MIACRFRHVLRLVAVLALGLTATSLLRSVATAAQAGAGQDAVVDVQSEGYPPSIKAALDNREPPALKRVYTRDSIPNSVTLAPVTQAPPLPASDRAKRRLQVGFSRDIPAGGAASLRPGALIWDAIDGGSVTAVSVASPGAVAMRLAVAFGSLPAGMEIRFFGPGPGSQVFGPVTPEQIRALTLPAEAGEPGVYWSPVVSGDTAGMEIFVPTGLERSLSFTIPRVSHQTRSVESAEKVAGSCNIDLACYSASWGTSAQAVAKISFISGGGSYVCTGTLLNDTDSTTFIPYFMTAEHCISTQSEASTINSFWNYQRTTCGGVLGSYTTLFGGATLLSHGASSDHSFLRLNDPAPSSAWFLGWTSATVSPATSMVGIHHPDGDVKKISLGVIDGIANYGDPVTGSGGYLRVHWTAGVTEGGSSGSAVITGSYPNDRFVGSLTGGASSCSLPTGGDWYGRFDLVYPLISAYLSPTLPPGPVQLTAAVTGATTVRLAWTTSAGATSYRIKRSTVPGAEVFLTSTASSSLVDTVTNGTTYYYVVSAFNSPLESANSNEVSATAGRAVVSDITGDFRADLGTFNPKTGTWAVVGLANQSWGVPGDVLVPADYTGAGKVQVAISRPSNGYWFVQGGPTVQWGQAGDIPVPGNYNGTGQAQIAVYRPSNGYWFVNGGATVQWGVPGDIPVPADYNGDGRTDIAIFRPSNGYWFVRNGVSAPWGASGDIPVPADYNGDGKADIAVYRPSSVAWWYVRGVGSWQIGAAGDVPVPQDLDGDGRAELSVYRPVNGAYYSYSWITNTWQPVTTVSAGQVPLAVPVALRKGVAGDVDRDRRREPAIYRPSDGRWWTLNSGGTTTSVAWGVRTDVPVAADYDGDGVLDFAIYRPSDGRWWILFSASGYTTSQGVAWGGSTDIPVVGDLDGDGRSDLIVYRPSNATWWALLSSTGYSSAAFRSWSWGQSADVPISGDFDGDGRTDITVYRPSNATWWSLLSSTGYATYRSWTWGSSGDQPAVGDYDGDGVTDIAIYRPSDGRWWILTSASNFTASRAVQWGGGGAYTLVPGDYDGDGKTDLGLWSPAGTWYVLRSSSDFTTWATYAWGGGADIPVPKQ